ncbi:MAG: SRPBCC family protein [Dehalococcoidia bacterium]
MPKRTWQHEQLIEVDAPPDAVYRYLADFGSQVDWSERVVDVERPAGGFVVGATFTTAGPATEDHRRLRITALQSPMRIAWEVGELRSREAWEFLLLPASKGRTSLARRVTIETGGRLRWLLGGKRRAERLAVENETALERIKLAIEASLRAAG